MKNIIGVTGGIGCGKSKLISIMVEQYNCLVIDTDSVAKRLMEPGEISYKLIVEHFGTKILSDDGRIDSKKLSKIVMSDAKQLEILNRFTHPYVIKEIKRISEEEYDKYDAVVIESALLLDTPIKDMCNEIWNVTADMEIRLERLCNFRGYEREQAEKIIANQKPESWYEKNTTKTFINNSDNGADMLELLHISMVPYAK